MNLVGKTVGTWKLVARLGEGGMGEVYLAEHVSIGRKAAVKVLHPEYAAQPKIVERFFNEARAANKVRHPSIIEIWDYGQSPETGAYFVMEFLEGESMQNRLRHRGRLPPVEVASILSRVASAVGAAHKAGIIHRDLKPDNVFLLPDSDHPTGERVKVLDFGIAKLAGDGAVGSSQTRTGSVMGTPIYMSPEQCHGAKRVDLRTDIYALGVMAYEALCGRPPFVAQGFGELLAMHLATAPQPLREIEPLVPPKLEAAVLRALAKDPDHRWASMDEFGAALVDGVDGAVKGTYPPAVGIAAAGTQVLQPPAAGAAAPSPSRPSSPSAPKIGGTGPSATEAFESQPTMHPSQAGAARPGTLTGSAMELTAAPSGTGKRVAIGAVVGLVLAVGITAFLVFGGVLESAGGDDTTDEVVRDDEDPDTAGATASARTAAAEDDRPDGTAGTTETAGSETARPETAAPETAAPATAVVPPKAVKVRHIIESDPVAATVFRVSDGAEVGITPWDSDEPLGKGKVTYELRKEGYKPARVTLSAERDGRKDVKLTAVKKKPATAAPKPPRTAAPKGTTTAPTTHAPVFVTPD